MEAFKLQKYVLKVENFQTKTTNNNGPRSIEDWKV